MTRNLWKGATKISTVRNQVLVLLKCRLDFGILVPVGYCNTSVFVAKWQVMKYWTRNWGICV